MELGNDEKGQSLFVISYKEGLPIRCFVRMRNLGMAPCRPAPLRKAV